MTIRGQRKSSTSVVIAVCCVLAATAMVAAYGRRSILRKWSLVEFPPLLTHASIGANSPQNQNGSGRIGSTLRGKNFSAVTPSEEPPASPILRDDDQSIPISTIQRSRSGLAAVRFGTLDPTTGQFIPTNEVQVTFLKNGRRVASLRPQLDGMIHVQLKPAIYSIVASGLGGIAVQNLRVVDAEMNATTMPLPFEVAIVPAQDLAMVRLLLHRRKIGSVESVQKRAGGQERLPAAAEARLTRVAAVTPDYHHYIRLHPGGVLMGRMGWLDIDSESLYALERVELYIIKDREIAAQIYTDPQGRFSVSSLRTGRYSIIGFGGNVPGSDTKRMEGGLMTASVYLTSDRDVDFVDATPVDATTRDIFFVRHVEAIRGLRLLSVNMTGAQLVKTAATTQSFDRWRRLPVVTQRSTKNRRSTHRPRTPRVSGSARVASVSTRFTGVDQSPSQDPASTSFSK